MKTTFKWIGKIAIILVVIAIIISVWQREKITRLMAVNTLFSSEKIVHNFSNMDTAFLSAEMAVEAAPSPLPNGETASLPGSFNAWVQDRSVTSTIILKDGKIVHEAYYQGTSADDLRIGWSLSKSILSALFGIALNNGDIESLDDPVAKYVPALRESAYAGATVKNVLQMSSGVTFDEDYLDYNSDINRMGRVLALGRTMDGFASALSETDAPAGAAWKYVSIDTHILGMVIRGATGRSIPDLMTEQLINPLGLQKSPYYLTDGEGVAFVLGGINMTTRDYARLAQMYLNDGAWNGQQIVPADWVRASTQATAKTGPDDFGYGYHWWMAKDVRDGEFMARGIYGQNIYINRPKGIVIVTTAADRLFREKNVNDQNVAMFRALTSHLNP